MENPRAPRDRTLFGRERGVHDAIDVVQAGASVDVVGSRSSGRSAFLDAVRMRLEDAGWTVPQVRGVSSLREHPFGALHLAGIMGSTTRPWTLLQDTAFGLQQVLTAAPPAALIVDDWDDLDESSWGVIQAVRKTTGTPVLRARLQGVKARHTPTGLPTSTMEPSFTFEMTALRFEEMEKALAVHLSAPVETSTASRIFAKSGGNIGLALNLVDAAVRSGRMVLRYGHEWVAAMNLWSPELATILEAHIDNIEDDARDALEMISIIGVIDVEMTRRLVPRDVLELLEERRLIGVVTNADRQLVTVIPPLLGELFRQRPSALRRARLSEYINERLGAAETAPALLAAARLHRENEGEQSALFVRLLQESARAQRVVAAAEWQANPAPGHAIRYVRALLLSPDANSRETAARVFVETDQSRGDTAQRAEFLRLHAQWIAYMDGDLERALAQLDSAPTDLDVYGKVLDATKVRLLTHLGSIPSDFETLLEVDDELPRAVLLLLLETRLLVLVIRGEFTQARQVYEQVSVLDRERVRHIPQMLMGLLLIGEGNRSEAHEVLQRGLDEAYSRLDIEALRAFASISALGHMTAGDYAALEEVLDSVLAAGEPTPFPPAAQLALLTIASVLAVRRGRPAEGKRLIDEISRLGIPDALVVGQSQAWARAQLLAFQGEHSGAAETMWTSATSLWERGGRVAALTAAMSSLELAPSPERIELVGSWLRQVPDARSLHSNFRYVKALAAEDPEAMLAAADALEGHGLTGLALSAYEHAAKMATEAGGDPAIANERAGQLRERHGGRPIDTSRYGSTAASLTERERQVARLASEGHSNQQIATMLVLSVRTVENHMHRIMRKLGISTRRALKRHFQHPLDEGLR